MRVGIVGAGLAGLGCAARLVGDGHAVTLFDKGRGPGGRLSTRRAQTPLGEVRFDHGAQYFTARDPDFARQVAAWARDGIVARWPAAGEDAWVGTPGMNAPARALASGLAIRLSARVAAIRREAAGWQFHGEGLEAGPFDAAVVAVPAEQAGALVGDWSPDLAAAASSTPAAPCWTVMATFPERLPIPADVVTRRGSIGWAARDSAKPGRAGPESWVVQAGPEWSRDHLEETPAAVAPALLAALAEIAGPDAVAAAWSGAHRWRYARSGAFGRDALWDAGLGLGLCGDWLLGPRVECAWVSGHRLAGMITAGQDGTGQGIAGEGVVGSVRAG